MGKKGKKGSDKEPNENQPPHKNEGASGDKKDLGEGSRAPQQSGGGQQQRGPPQEGGGQPPQGKGDWKKKNKQKDSGQPAQPQQGGGPPQQQKPQGGPGQQQGGQPQQQKPQGGPSQQHGGWGGQPQQQKPQGGPGQQQGGQPQQQKPQGGPSQQHGGWGGQPQQQKPQGGPGQQQGGQPQQQRPKGGPGQQKGGWGGQPQQQGGQTQQQKPQGGQTQQHGGRGGQPQQQQPQGGPGQQQGGQPQPGGWNCPPPQQRPQASQAQQPGGWGQPPPQGAPGGQPPQQRPQGGPPQQLGAWGGQPPPQGAPGGQPPQQRPQGGPPQQPGAWGGQRPPQEAQRGQPQQQGAPGGQPPQQRQQGGPPQQHGGRGGQQQSQGQWSGQQQRQGPRGPQQQAYRGDQPPSEGSHGGGRPQGGYSGQRGPRQQGYDRTPSEQSYGSNQSQGRGSQQSLQSQSSVPLVGAHANSPARGTVGYKFQVETNYLTLDLSKMPDTAYHYDVKIDPDRPKKFMRHAFDEFVKKVFPGKHIAYDGKASAYSPEKLSEQVLNANQEAQVVVKIEAREIPYKVTVKATDDVEVDLKSLKTYHKERIFDKPMRALQCIEVVLSAPCHEKGVRAGRSYFTPPSQRLDLDDGFELWFGLYQAAMLCDQPLLNIDVSHKSFPSKVDLVPFYDNMRGGQRALGDFLKGLHVQYNPPNCFKGTPKLYKFNDIKDASGRQLFTLEDGTRLTVADYFQSKGYKLKRPDLPCLHVGSSTKNIYIPMELLEIPPGQAIMRKDSENQVRKMIRYAATSTNERKEKIMRLLHHFNYNIHPTVQRFGLSVGNQFIRVEARRLDSPQIQYDGGAVKISRPGEWMQNNMRFLKTEQKNHEWAIINISRKREINVVFLQQNFIQEVVNSGDKLGLKLASTCEIIEPPDAGPRARLTIMPELKKLKAKNVSLVFVILPFSADSYSKVKQEAELSCGIVTQCIKGDTMFNPRGNRGGPKIIDKMTVGNILLKVNAKLNGSNHKIAASNEIGLQKSRIMFVGADVSHPSPLQKNIPSIVGVVASHDAYGTQYNMQYRLQSPKKEEIEDMRNIFAHHLKVYKKFNGGLPDNIIYYRDGVSDGQFPLIDKIEVAAMRAACQAEGCKAKFTVIIVVKRHHTRFFPDGRDAEGKFNNVMAGTVVDRTIIHPNEVQFFMVSHKAIQGTSKPTRYNVIIDDAKINIDDLQRLTYNLCHLFPRCNRSVSYPAPAYLSHLVGLRGKAYIEGSNVNLENLKAENAKRKVSDDMSFNPMYFV